MQGGEGNSNSFQGNCVVPNSSAQNANNSPTWIGESSSRQDLENHISFRRLIGDDLWHSSPENQSENSQMEEAEDSDEPNFSSLIENMSLSEINSFLENNSRKLCGGPVSMEHEPITSSVMLGQASSGTFQSNLDLNSVVEESRTEDAIHQENGPNLSLHHSASAASAGRVPFPSTGGSSISQVMIHSGSAGYVIEENPSTENPDPADGNRRLSCKRSAPENASAQSGSGSGSGSSSARLAANLEQPVIATGSLNAETSSDNNNLNRIHPPRFGINEIGQAGLDNFYRSTRLRRGRGEDNVPSNLWTWNPSTNSNIPPFFPPFTNLPNTSSASVPAFLNISPFSSTFPHPGENYLRNNRRSDMMPPFSGNPNNGGATMLWGGSSSNSADQLNNVGVGEGLGQQEDNNLMNNRRDNVLPFLGPMQGNLNSNFFRSFPSSSSMRPPQQNVDDAISQALQDLANQSESWRELNICPIHFSGPFDPALRPGYLRNISLPPLRLAPRSERQSGNGFELSPVLLPQSAPPRRNRMISEVRNALGLVRRDGSLQLEDVMVIDRSFFVGLPEFPDHEDLQLDVDNMSFEEILHLEEQLGDGCTGLSDETILANLRRRKYQTITFGSQAEAELCVICQEEYEDGEELGKVDCGHDFHFNCIKQWLVEKNSCPICKKTALAI